jgi:hypothetical protein
MPREIKSPKPVILTSKSFDGKHTIEFNEGSHRYKLNAKSAVGVTTFTKGGYITSMGLISWMKSQTAEALFKALTVPADDGFYPRAEFWPVTQAVKEDLIKEAKLADRAVSQEAADIGTICHGFAELHSLGQFAEAQAFVDQVKGVEAWPLIKLCVSKYLDWAKTNKGKLVHAEALVASPTHLFCGKFDRLDLVADKLILRDYKTSKDIFLEQYIQLAAYAIAIKEWLGLNVEGLEVLRFGKDDGTFDSLLVDNPAEIQVFKEQAIRCRQTYEFRKLENDPRWKYEPATKESK